MCVELFLSCVSRSCAVRRGESGVFTAGVSEADSRGAVLVAISLDCRFTSKDACGSLSEVLRKASAAVV